MTREHKLALIVGFSLVLIVGVLLSDHFSQARASRVGNDLAAGSPRDFGAGGMPNPIPVADRPIRAPGRPELANTTNDGPDSATTAVGAPQTDHPRVVIDMGPRGPGTDLSAALPATPNRTPGHAAADPPDTRLPPTVQFPPAAPAGAPPVVPVQPGRPERAGPPTVGPSAGNLPTSTGTLKRHEVKDNDNLYALAVKYYGDGKLWSKLAAFNKGRVGSEGQLHVGVSLLVPPKDVLLGKAAMPAEAAPASAPPPQTPDRRGGKPPAPAPPTSSAGSVKAGEVKAVVPGAAKPAPAPDRKPAAADKSANATYTIKPGDHLSSIAQNLLGSSRRWTEIADLNSDAIPDPDDLTAGVTIKIPAR